MAPAVHTSRGARPISGLLASHFDGKEPLEARQIVEQTVDLVITSCGYAVPEYEYQGERDTLIKYWEARGADGVKAYWAEKNMESLDGLPTGFEAIAGTVPGQ